MGSIVATATGIAVVVDAAVMKAIVNAVVIVAREDAAEATSFYVITRPGPKRSQNWKAKETSLRRRSRQSKSD